MCLNLNYHKAYHILRYIYVVAMLSSTFLYRIASAMNSNVLANMSPANKKNR